VGALCIVRNPPKLREEQGTTQQRSAHRREGPDDILVQNRMYVSCQVDEDLGYIIQQTGESNLLVGSDFTHNDAAQEMDFVGLLNARADKGDIPRSAVKKITEDNPKRFYAI
jgi:hypothetical protein